MKAAAVPPNPKRWFSRKRVGALMGGILVILATWFASPLMKNGFSPAPVSTKTAFITVVVSTDTLEPISTSEIPTITSAPTESFTPTATPFPTEITDGHGVVMRLVPEGEFMMGTDKSNFSGEYPAHKVYLNDYYIDKYEVTNLLYKACVDEKICAPPYGNQDGYFDSPDFVNFPVKGVDWFMADTYCKSRSARLPTEAEWEKAARGTDERTYPWGDTFQSSFTTFGVDNMPIGSFKSGKSVYDVYDMVGNVNEWVADWYDVRYYKVSPPENPLGPDAGKFRVIRGGSYLVEQMTTYYRLSLDPNRAFGNGGTGVSEVGIRCAKAVNQ